MTTYLVIRLYAPLVSWGEIAVGDIRHSAVHPSRSALLGLLGAALGIERTDNLRQKSLSESFRFGIWLQAIGGGLRDYHTIQFGKEKRGQVFYTRRDELFGEKIDARISHREYRSESVSVVAIEALPNAITGLKDLALALKQPRFTLYLGRKSCPLAEPLLPQIIEAENLKQAFEKASFPSLFSLNTIRCEKEVWPNQDDKRLFNLRQQRYYWDNGMNAGMNADFHQIRHDQPLSRTRWQFTRRQEWVALSEVQGEAA